MINSDQKNVAEKKLQSSLKEISDYKFALDESCIVAITDQKGIITYANDNFCKISKFSREELIGQDHRIINSGFHPKKFIADLWVTIANGKIWRGELKNKAKDGSSYWVDTTIVPFLNNQKKPYQYVAIRSDITSRKNMEEELKLFSSVIDSSDDSITSEDINGIITSWNYGAEKIFGYSSTEIIGQHISLLIPAHRQNEDNDMVNSILNNVSVDNYQTERIRKNGQLFYVSVTISPIKDPFGNIIGVSKIARDITERKIAEEKLIASEELFQHSFDNMLEGAQIHDFNWRYIYVNDSLVKYSSYSREELLGYSMMEKYPGIEQTDLFKVLQRCMTDRVAEQLETEFIFPDGSKKHFELSIQPIPEGIFILSLDRTEHKKAKEKLLKVHRLYAFVSAVNNSVVHISDEQLLLDNACNIAINIGQFKLAWIDMVEKTTGKLTMVTSCGDQGVIENVKKLSVVNCDDPLLRNTPTGKAIKTGVYAVSNDVQNDPYMIPWKKHLVENGIKAFISLPIKKYGEVIGVFGLHSSIKDFFDQEEITLLEEATNDISFALEILEKTKNHKLTEELLIHNEERFRALIEKSADMMTLSNLEGELIYASPSIHTVLGYTLGEFLYKKVSRFIHPEDLPDLAANQTDILQAAGKSFNFQCRLLHKNGSWIWCEGTLTNMLQESGIHALVSNFRDISEKKISELDQIENKNLIQSIYAASIDAVIIINKESIIVKWDDKSEDLFGWKEKDVLGRKLSEIIIPERYRERHENGIKHYLRTKEGPVLGKTIDITALKHTGAEFDVSLSITPSKINGDIHFIGFIRDISERKKSEQNLRQNEKRLKESQAIAHLGNWELNFATDVAIWSDEALRIYGLSTSENSLTFEHWVSLIHPGDLDYVLEETQSARKNLAPTNLDHRILLNDGIVKHIHSESKFEFDQNGNPVGLYGIAQDITERKLAEENLVTSELNLKEAQAIAQVGNWVINMADNSNVWSDELYHIFGIDKKIETPSTELFLAQIHPDDADSIYEIVQRAFTTFENSSFDFKFLRKDGVVRCGFSEWRFEFDKSRQPTRFFGIIQDVTDRKLAEIERTNMMNDLMLRNKDLEQFAYIISHNLRAPVANILGASNALNSPGLSEEDKVVLSSGLNESVVKLDNVIKDLNHVLKVKGKIGEPKEKVIFSQLVDDIKISVKNLIDEGSIKIKCDFSDIEGFLTLKSYLYSIFYNLIVNSIKYRQPEASCVIEIKSRISKNKIQLIFTDNGMGIDLDKRGGQVFGLYRRFHTNIEGKGMGLFMVKTQVETLGGKISITSEVNKGTQFTIEFE